MTPLGPPILLHFNLKKSNLYFAFLLSDIWWRFLLLILCCFKAKYMHCTFLVCWQCPQLQLVPFVRTLTSKNISGRLFVKCLSENVFSAVFCHFNLKMHQPFVSLFSFHSKYIKHALFLCLKSWKRKVYMSCRLFTFKTSIVPFLLLRSI